jgi:hypothetical protein
MEHCAIIFKKISGAEGNSIVLFSILFVFAGKPKQVRGAEKQSGLSQSLLYS